MGSQSVHCRSYGSNRSGSEWKYVPPFSCRWLWKPLSLSLGCILSWKHVTAVFFPCVLARWRLSEAVSSSELVYSPSAVSSIPILSFTTFPYPVMVLGLRPLRAHLHPCSQHYVCSPLPVLDQVRREGLHVLFIVIFVRYVFSRSQKTIDSQHVFLKITTCVP